MLKTIRQESMYKLKFSQKSCVAICLVTAFLIASCKGADGGFAPSMKSPSVIVSGQLSTALKNGSEIKTANGWTLQLDTSDPMKNLTTTNGWKIEAKYE